MRKFRGRHRGAKWARPVDWDWANLTGLVGPNAGYYTWVRVPSETIDPSNDTEIVPKTLVRTLVRADFQTGPLPEPGSVLNGTFYFGIIAWRSSTPADPTFGFAGWPDPTNGAYDWVFWAPIFMTNVSSGTGANVQLKATFGNDTETGWTQSRAMRKLPPQTGLLMCLFYDGGLGSTPIIGLNIGVRLALKGDVSAVGLGGG